jgi:Na+/H+ antiporter NhaD/arsenite permease-like protein
MRSTAIAMSIFAIMAAEPPRALMLPFALLLIAIAIAPVVLRHHWERHYYKVCFALTAFVSGYYWWVRGDTVRVLHALFEYGSFMIVIGSFFTVAGGIHLRVRGSRTPLTNTIFLVAGALIANVIGTIGASMLLIRPWIEMNKPRFAGFHVAFFIFLVSNIGGALLPVGPPLFLGYQKGIPFLWPVIRLWPHWLFVTALVVLIFYVVDRRNCIRSIDIENTSRAEKWRIFGKRNFVFLLLLLIALVALPAPARELTMIAVATGSYFISPKHVHQSNAFTFLPLKEVAVLFLGIFGTMIPVIDYVELHAQDLGVQSGVQFFWVTGLLSAILDNAPTYLTFLAGAFGLHGLDMNNTRDVTTFLAHEDHSLVAISLGATFFGALTYVGNSPNLLVRAIAQNLGMPAPSFFGFVFRYAAPVLLPIFVLLSVVFFRK